LLPIAQEQLHENRQDQRMTMKCTNLVQANNQSTDDDNQDIYQEDDQDSKATDQSDNTKTLKKTRERERESEKSVIKIARNSRHVVKLYSFDFFFFLFFQMNFSK
jgi:hypothetical protein